MKPTCDVLYWHLRIILLSYFSKRRMDIKEEGPVDVVAAHLSKVRLIPAENTQKKHISVFTNITQL